MKHSHIRPGLRDILRDHSLVRTSFDRAHSSAGANDNAGDVAGDLADPLFVTMARREIAATRLW